MNGPDLTRWAMETGETYGSSSILCSTPTLSYRLFLLSSSNHLLSLKPSVPAIFPFQSLATAANALMGRIGNFIEQMRGVSWRSVGKEATERSFLVAKFLCFCHITNNYICSIALVYGPSMLPTINLTGDLVLVERMSHRIGHVGVGDVVLVRSPENPRKIVTKRITGMEGDRVTFAVDPRVGDRLKTVVVPKGHVFVQGDNIFASNDSRNFGPVPYSLIQAKALIRIWPPSAFGPLGQRV